MKNMQYKEIPRWKQQLGGLFILLVSIGFIIRTWYTALYDEYFYPKASLVFPMFFVLGLGMMLFPDYKTERVKRGEDISQLEGVKLLTARWWVILAIALLAGFGNYLLIRYLWNQ
jgi:ABC-type Fe3+-siderophore transport system permease subunit